MLKLIRKSKIKQSTVLNTTDTFQREEKRKNVIMVSWKIELFSFEPARMIDLFSNQKSIYLSLIFNRE